MKKRETSSKDADLIGDYSKHVLLEYRQTILHILLLTTTAILILVTVVNIGQLVVNPQVKWGIRNLISDGIALIFFFFLWKASKRGYVALVSWVLCLMMVVVTPESTSIITIYRAVLFMAVPVVLSSFVIHPYASFPFTIVAIGWYTVTYFRSNGTFEYDVLSIGALFCLAIGAYTVASALNKTIRETVSAYDETIEGWAKALEMRDSETVGHSKRVIDLTLELAIKLGVKEKELIHIRRGVFIHDLGKMAVPDAILHKPGPLTDEEWQIMRKHPEYAKQYLSKVSYLAPALDIPYCHHEKWDGTGYPQGLKGEQIPLSARVFAVVDVWDALTSDRPYRKSWSREKALQYIQEQSGKHFDPKIATVFVDFIQSQ